MTEPRKEDRASIYWKQPKEACFPGVYLNGLWLDYEKHMRSYNEIRFRRDQAAIIALVPPDDQWYECFITMSEGEARSIRSSVAHGEYGIHLACVYTFEENGNNSADPQQKLHRVFVRRDKNS